MDLACRHLAQELSHRRLTDRNNGVCHGSAHEAHGFTEEEDLYLMAGLTQRVGVRVGRLGIRLGLPGREGVALGRRETHMISLQVEQDHPHSIDRNQVLAIG